MSDGHFNRSLLPHNDYQSALKVGKALERKRCEDALKEILEEILPNNSDLKDLIITKYKEKIH